MATNPLDIQNAETLKVRLHALSEFRANALGMRSDIENRLKTMAKYAAQYGDADSIITQAIKDDCSNFLSAVQTEMQIIHSTYYSVIMGQEEVVE